MAKKRIEEVTENVEEVIENVTPTIEEVTENVEEVVNSDGDIKTNEPSVQAPVDNPLTENVEEVTAATEYVMVADIYFQDKYDKTKFYNVGEELTIVDEARKNDLIERKLAHLK